MIEVVSMDRVLQKLNLFKKIGMKNILVSCSGGSDSMALLNICKLFVSKNDMNMRAIHINHNIQSKNIQWANDVKLWCDELDIELININLSINYASNTEEVARLGRQTSVAESIRDDEWLLTAHHANDQAENIIMALARSGGHHALSGMNDISEINGYISAKPMLEVSKNDVYNYCEAHKITFVEDPTNFESVQDRNFVRNKVIPLLETRWPNFVNSSNKSASLIKKISKILSDSVDADADSIFIDDLPFMSDSSEETMRIWLKKRFGKSAGNNIVNQIITFSKSSGGHWIDSNGFRLGVWKNTIFDLSIDKQYDLSKNGIKYRPDLSYVRINGVNKKLKKVFKEYNIPPWDRNNIPFYFKDDKLVGIGNYSIPSS